MKLTEQQSLILFDIAKTAMNIKGGFAGYSNEEIMKLINHIISQQDNKKIVNTTKNRIIPKVPKKERSQLSEGVSEKYNAYQPDEELNTTNTPSDSSDFWGD